MQLDFECMLFQALIFFWENDIHEYANCNNSKMIYLCELKSKCTYNHIYKVSNNNNGEFLKSAIIKILNKPIID